MKKMRAVAVAVVVAMCFVFAACGQVENATSPKVSEPTTTTPAPDESSEAPYTKTLASDAAITDGNTAVVFNGNFIDPIGSISTIDLLDNTAKTARITTDGSDVVVRSFGGRIYVINRYLADTIQVINPADFSVVANYSVGAASNPQDIVVVSDDKAYISRLDSQNDKATQDDIIIVNPLTGQLLGGIDLKPYTTDDGERLARAAQMVLVDKYVYVAMQDLPLNMLKPADTNGKVAVIDTTTDEVFDVGPDVSGVQVIELQGRNPSDITYSPLTEKIYVADTGVYVNFVVDTSDGNGGIEVIDQATNKTEGIVIDDAAFGGGVAEVRIASADVGYTIIDSMAIASFSPKTREVLNQAVYTSPSMYLPDFSIDANGKIYVAEQDFNNPGVIILNSDGSVAAGPIAVGAPPSSIAFVDVE